MRGKWVDLRQSYLMKWVIAKMLNLDAETIIVSSEKSEDTDGKETVYIVEHPSGTVRISMSKVLEYIEHNMEDKR